MFHHDSVIGISGSFGELLEEKEHQKVDAALSALIVETQFKMKRAG